MKARWGMSPDEVMATNQISLSAPMTNKRFFSPREGEEGRFKVLTAQGQRFLGREADVYYTFKDNKLCMYHIFVSDNDEARLDADMRKYLTRKWGGQEGGAQEDATLKLVWQFKDRNVNYWLYEEEMSLTAPFKAGIGVTYKPLADS